MKIKFYKNPERIGGGITELSYSGHRLIIDMGADLPDEDKQTNEEQEQNPRIEGLTKGKANCDGVLISHYHGDHIGLLSYVLPEINIYMTRTTAQVVKTIYSELKEFNVQGRLKETIQRIEKAKFFGLNQYGRYQQVGIFQVMPLRVDHSAFDSLMFLVQVGNKKVLFTGDFRNHGYTGKHLIVMLEKYVGKVDCIITEGTMMGSRSAEMFVSEEDVFNKAKELCRKYHYVIYLASSTNIDTQLSFYRAAKAAGRQFRIDDFQRRIFQVIAHNATSDFYKPKFDNNHQTHGVVIAMRLGHNLRRIRMLLERYGDASVLVYSLWDGYIERSFELQNLEKELGSRFIKLHSSGHAYPQLIKQVIETCSTPNTLVVPMHTESIESFEKLQTGQRIIKLQKDEELEMP